MAVEPALEQSIERIDRLVEGIERDATPAVQEQMRELVKCLLDYHGAAIGRVMQLLQSANGDTAATLGRLLNDDLVASLLALHGCHPQDYAERVAAALAQVRPLLASHGGDVELVGIEDGVISLRLLGNCHGCPSSTATMKTQIEQAIFTLAPETVAVELASSPPDNAQDPVAGFVPLEHLTCR